MKMKEKVECAFDDVYNGLKEIFKYGHKDNYERDVDRLCNDYPYECDCEVYGRCNEDCLCFECAYAFAKETIRKER